MFIASLICLILGLALLAISVYLFFKLDVREALNFIRNKRTGKSSATLVSKQRRRPNLKSSGKAKIDSKRGSKKKLGTTKIAGDAIKKPKMGSDADTYVLEDEDSEDATGILSEDSENPTGLLDDTSETPTGILAEDSETPTGILAEDSETPTGILAEDSEMPTGILVEDSETPTGILIENSEEPTGVLEESDVITKKADVKKPKSTVKTIDSDFKFDVVKDVVVVHTQETLE